jgi:hypothetical protein
VKQEQQGGDSGQVAPTNHSCGNERCCKQQQQQQQCGVGGGRYGHGGPPFCCMRHMSTDDILKVSRLTCHMQR